MENKIITIYELLGLIREGKAPKKIKYSGTIYCWNGCSYWTENSKEPLSLILNPIPDIVIPNLIVKILPEENDEWEDIEEINIENDGHNDFIKNEHGTKCGLTKHSKIIAEKVNELIKNQQKIIEKLESKDD